MRRANHLLELITDPDNLRLASWKAAKGKRHARSVLGFQKNLEANLRALRLQIESGQVEVGDYHYFKIFEPKERQICASAFSEQVLHHALMNVCHGYFERAQVFDSYASRKGKGTYAAINRAKEYTKHYAWYLKLDVRKFFDSVHHDTLKGQLGCLFKEPRLHEIFFRIIDSFEASPDRGLPIGNLTSQYFANHYLSGLDHFIKERLKVKAYVRYMDDMVLWSDEKAALQDGLDAIEDYVQTRLRCALKPETLNKTRHGLPFLGYRIFPHYVWLLHKSKIRFIRKISKVDFHYRLGDWTEAACQRRALPLIAFTEHADAKQFRKNVLLSL